MKRFIIILSALVLSAAASGCSDSDSSSSSGSTLETAASTAVTEAPKETEYEATTSLIKDETGDMLIITEKTDEEEVPKNEIPEELIGDSDVSPMIECSDAKEAKEISGVDFKAPDKMDTFEEPSYNASDSGITEVHYKDSQGENMIVLRKGKGSRDVSGDNNAYILENKEKVGDIKVTMKGDQELIYCAVWSKDGCSYSLAADYGLKVDSVRKMIEDIMKNEK